MNVDEFRKTWIPLAEAAYRVAMYILEDDEQAKDAVQDVFLKLWESRDKLDDIKSPKSYVLMAVRNTCISKIRKEKEVIPLQDDVAVTPPEENIMIGKEKIRRVLKLIEGLPEKQRMAIRMRCVEGLEYDEISKQTGLTENNLRVLISNARKTLKEKQ